MCWMYNLHVFSDHSGLNYKGIGDTENSNRNLRILVPLCSTKDFSEQTPRNGQSCHDDGNHAHQLDEDVEARPGRVLERIAYRITHHSGTMHFASLSAEVAFFNVFLRIVPCASSVCHEDGEHEAGRKSSDKQSDYSRNAEYQAGSYRISRNWRRTSSTMREAARPTAFMVSPQNRKAIMLPMNMPEITFGFISVTS